MSLFYVQKGIGQSLVFVHGIPTDYRAWDAQTDAFSESHRVIVYSRRYAHPNERDGDILDSTIENNSADLAGLIDKLGVAPVNLVGHSYGGFIAAYLASKNPELLRTLTLVDPAVPSMLVRNPKNPLELISLLLRSPSTGLSAVRYTTRSLNPSLAAFHRGEFDTALRFNLDGIMNKKGALDQFPESVRLMMKENEKTVGEVGTKFPVFTKGDASRISTPTLLMNGADSPKFLHSILNELAGSIPNNEVARIQGSAHFPHIERPAEFNARLREFLGKHP